MIDDKLKLKNIRINDIPMKRYGKYENGCFKIFIPAFLYDSLSKTEFLTLRNN